MYYTSKEILEAAALFRLITPESRELVSSVLLGIHMMQNRKGLLETSDPVAGNGGCFIVNKGDKKP